MGRISGNLRSIHKGHPQNLMDHVCMGYPTYTKNRRHSWVRIDLGIGRCLIPNYYSLRHGGVGKGNAIRSWKFQARVRFCDKWKTLRVHTDDESIAATRGAVASWSIATTESDYEHDGFRYFRILQTGINSSGNHCLFCAGIELYGKLTVSTADEFCEGIKYELHKFQSQSDLFTFGYEQEVVSAA